MPQSELVQSVIRALDILRTVVESPNGMRLNEVADSCGLKVTTAHNLLRSLCARGFLSKDASGHFVGGTAIGEMARINGQNTLLKAAVRALPAVAEKLPRAVITFSCMTPDAVRCLLRMSPDRPGQVQRPLDLTFQPYVSVSGICLQSTAANAVEFENNRHFQDYGMAHWGSHADFLAAKENTRKLGCFSQIIVGRFAAAFAIPDNYCLGVSMDAEPEGGMGFVQKAAEDFKLSLLEKWEEI